MTKSKKKGILATYVDPEIPAAETVDAILNDSLKLTSAYAGKAEAAMRNVIINIRENGQEIAPRGQKVIEVEHATYVLPPYVRFQNFDSRKLSLDYIKREMLWYLRGNKKDLEICQHAKMWGTLVNHDGSINSNYGQYIFGKTPRSPAQFDLALAQLVADKDTRRASMAILARDHLASDTKDVPCTYSLNFRIRNDQLNMSVHMRSQDAVFGLGNDAATFSIIHEMMHVAARDSAYPDLKLGTYTHTADSLHIYERHYEMTEKIAYQNDPYKLIYCPRIKNLAEVNFLRGLIHLTYGRPDLAPLPASVRRTVIDEPLFAKFVVDHAINQEFEFSLWLTHFTKKEAA